MDSVAPERSLAHANLLRVRGQLAEAKAELLAFLAARPGDREALDLLARTCDDAGEADEARHWRGIAGQTPAGAEHPGAFAGRTGAVRYAVPVVIAVAVLAIGLALLTRGGERAAIRTVRTIEGRIEAPGTTASSVAPPPVVPVPQTSGTAITPTEPTTARSGIPGQTSAEARGLARLGLAEGAGGRALTVTHDPRTDTVTVTFAPHEGEPPRRAAATLARAAFATFLTVKTLQLRAVQRGELAYLATSLRDRLATVEAEGWANANEANPDALADALLSDEWTASEAASSNASGTGESTGANWSGTPPTRAAP